MRKLTRFVGLDDSKNSIDVAVASEGRWGEVRSYGTVPNTPEAVRKLFVGRAGPEIAGRRRSTERIPRRPNAASAVGSRRNIELSKRDTGAPSGRFAGRCTARGVDVAGSAIDTKSQVTSFQLLPDF